MSEMKRAARSLVEVRTERFESRHGLVESRARLAGALQRARIEASAPFETAWSEENGLAVLEVTFPPSRRARTFLNLASVGFLLLIAASVYLLRSTDEGALRFLVPLFTGLAVLAFPFVTLGIASSRAAQESRVRRAIRVALLDEDEAFPPAQRWDDEER
jgi:hypothetical protein